MTTTSIDDRQIESARLRQVLAHYPTGVAVVTTVHEGKPAGMVVGTFTSISLDPPLVGFFPRTGSGTLAQVCASETFCVNVLGADDEGLCHRFTSAPANDRFDSVDWSPGAHGAPVLTCATAWVDCHLEETRDIGDHTLVVGRVLDLGAPAEPIAPLIFHRGSYGTCAAS
ncbi:flavin reductase family protein [Rhodococcus sp. C26F]